MKHADHVDLLRGGRLQPCDGPRPGETWADLGAGTGAFTLALAELLGAGGAIYAVDRDAGALRALSRAFTSDRLPGGFSSQALHCLTADFTRPLDLPALDGAVMANALHFIRDEDKARVVRQVRGCLKPGGRLILVEYNVDRGNMWVPHPLSYPTWEKLARQAGFEQTHLLATKPSSFLREFFSSVSC